MLPYTPLHHLLTEPAADFPEVLVMTSGNLSDEPIAYEDEDSRRRLNGVADAFLFHDREIHVRCDDSVAAEHRAKVYFFRRSRGYAPLPLSLPVAAPSIMAVGGELKNTFCMTRDDLAFVSHHIGDLDYLETLCAFETGLEHYERLFRIQPKCVAHDLHPDYQSTRYARKRAVQAGIPAIAVQHHHAHIASGMADNGLALGERVIGVAMDGTGYGPDGTIWGGEFLVADYRDYNRVLHLAYCPLPGGDAAIRSPYRIGLSWLRAAGIPWDGALPPVAAATNEERGILKSQLETEINTPPTSSMGRLFDAVSSIIGLCHRVTYEAQAACELESVADPSEKGSYTFNLGDETVDPAPMLHALVTDWRRGIGPETLSARFHNGVADVTVKACERIREKSGLERVVLSGGVWQNLVLLRKTVARLEGAGFRVLVHHRVPANDGGLALGQALIAAARLQGEGDHEDGLQLESTPTTVKTG
jgi:hydrogenase maturation protein HypF